VSPTLLVTRPRDQAAELRDLLRQRGMATIGVPTVEIDRSSVAAGLDRMLEQLDGVDWLILTSANGAVALAHRLRATRRSLPSTLHVAAVGPATADALRDAGILVDHVPSTYLTIAIAEGLGDVYARRIVLARADAATAGLREALTRRGAIVEEVVAYRTVEAPVSSRGPLETALRADLDGVTFTSSSTVRGLMGLATSDERAFVRETPAFCIGPVTARTALTAGFRVAAVAGEHTAAGLADAVAAHFAREDHR